jgi:hypothetical protein
MEMQSATAKSAQPFFTGDLARMAVTVLSAIALVAGLTVALVIIRTPGASSVSPTAGVEQALIQVRADERAAFVAPREAQLVQRALIDHRAAERASLVDLSDPKVVQQALIDHRAGERAPLVDFDQIHLADTYRWIGSYAPRAQDGTTPGRVGRGPIPE